MFLESRFPTIWLTLLFLLLWHVKYMPGFLITYISALVTFNVSEMLTALTWSSFFGMTLAWTKNERNEKGWYCWIF